MLLHLLLCIWVGLDEVSTSVLQTLMHTGKLYPSLPQKGKMCTRTVKKKCEFRIFVECEIKISFERKTLHSNFRCPSGSLAHKMR